MRQIFELQTVTDFVKAAGRSEPFSRANNSGPDPGRTARTRRMEK